MNNTEVQVIDTFTNTHIPSIEKALASSIRWGWKGGDSKDELTIVGSYLKFSMVGLSCEDGQYFDLFTGDETRYKVIYKNNDTGTIYFNGHLLPDAYSEPYRDAPITVDFTATDGLGRLKGKYLPLEYYQEEKSVIDIITQCLKLTGLDLNFRFTPAIENYLQKDYNQIFIDTADYREDNKRKRDAYDILDELLGEKGLQCTLYQADNVFNIEGWNIRNLRVYTCKVYDSQGNFIEEKEITRLSKKVTPLATPDITMQAPYGVIDIRHKREPVELPKTLSEEENDGWALPFQGVYPIYALDWFGNDNFHAYAAQYVEGRYTTFPNDRKDLQVYFGKRTGVGDEFIKLRQQPYLRKDSKYRIDLNFKIITELENLNETTRQVYVDNGFWTNPFDIKLSLQSEIEGIQQSEILYANYGVDVDGQRYREQDFSVDGEKDNSFEFVANNSGVLAIEIGGVDNINNGIFGIAIEEAVIEHLDFSEEYSSTTILNEDYTIKKEVELTYADDSTGESKAFRLKPLRTKGDSNLMSFAVSRTETRGDFKYTIVDLKGANLIKENAPETEPIEVIYNIDNSEEHAIKTPIGYNYPASVIYDFNAITENRDYWEQWTDSIYKIERIRFPEAVRNLYNRMYDIPVPKIDMIVKNNVKFNDFLNFPYRSKNSFMLTNCELDIDKGLTNVTVIESYYAVSTGSNIPPVVEAGVDIAIGNGVTEVNLTSEGYDPDGFIVSYNWTILEGVGAVIQNTNDNNTTVSGLTEDRYIFQVEVVDNQGAIATDTVTVYRDQTHTFLMEVTATSPNITKYQIVLTPEIPEGSAVNFQGIFKISRILEAGGQGTAKIRIWKNSSQIVNEPPPYPPQNDDYAINKPFSYSYRKGDIYEIELEASSTSPNITSAKFTVDTAEFVEGFGEVTGLPITKEQKAP